MVNWLPAVCAITFTIAFWFYIACATVLIGLDSMIASCKILQLAHWTQLLGSS